VTGAGGASEGGGGAGPGVAGWIADPAALHALVERLGRVPRLALDTEADGFTAYRPRLCLVQLAWEEPSGIAAAIVDPLALEGQLGPLRAPLEDPALETIVHGADYDLRLLKRDARIALRGLWDTQRAAQLLGEPQTGLAALAASLAGAALDKRAQRTDWSRRPLPATALEYAREDVRVLFAMRDALGARLERLGRGGWLDEECRRLEEVEPGDLTLPDAGQLLLRAKGALALSPGQRATLAELLSWREREAEQRGVPAVHVVAPEPLLALARQPADAPPDLAAAGVPTRVARRYERALLEAVARGRAAPPRPAERPPREPRPPRDERRRQDALRRARDQVAAGLGLSGSVICPGAVLREAARTPPDGFGDWLAAGLRRWQADLLAGPFGAALDAARAPEPPG
jgi:ribonuclease D